MPKFIREYVHCLMDNSLVGKVGFFADNALKLKGIVENNVLLERGTISNTVRGRGEYPFLKAENSARYRFFYHDPYWDLKCAVENGEVLETNVTGKWEEEIDLKGFLFKYNNTIPPEKYRTVRKTSPVDRIVSNLELAKWLACGHGQAYVDAKSVTCTDYLYYLEDEHKPVQDILVRAWGDTEWVVPTAHYLGLEGDCD